MPINVNEIMEACDVLARQENLNLTFQESLKGGLIAGVASFFGGIMLGPGGIALGAAAGGIAGTSMCRQFKPLYQVLQEMSTEDQNRLAVHLTNILNQLDITDAVLLMTVVRDPTHLGRSAIVSELGKFFGNSLVAR